MRILIAAAAAMIAGACVSTRPAPPEPTQATLVAAESLIDAFYSFQPDRLRAQMADAPGSLAELLFYQGWAEGGHYVVIKRAPCRFSADDEVRCDITVRDDLIAELRTGCWVTDSFHLTVEGSRIVSVRNSSNDPPEYDEALNWLAQARPGIMTGPCTGFFAGGPTPQACVKAVRAGFADWRAAHPQR